MPRRNVSIHLILLFFSMAVVRLAIAQDSEFVRLAHPKARLEAITGPLLLSGIEELTHHGGQTHLAIKPMHAKAGFAKELRTQVSRRLNEWKHTAEQLKTASVWQRVCEFIATAVTGFN